MSENPFKKFSCKCKTCDQSLDFPEESHQCRLGYTTPQLQRDARLNADLEDVGFVNRLDEGFAMMNQEGAYCDDYDPDYDGWPIVVA